MLKLKKKIKNVEKIIEMECNELIIQIKKLKNNFSNAKYLLLLSSAFLVGIRIAKAPYKKIILYLKNIFSLISHLILRV